jgi:zinc transport system substrate-binding protein
LVQPGQDPHTFEPAPRQVVALSRARLFFEIGMPFESALLEKIQQSNQRLAMVDTTSGIEKHAMGAPCGEDGHRHAEDANGGEPDPHVWLSPPLLKVMARNIAEALQQADPANARAYRTNLAALLARLDALHEKIDRLLAPYRGRAFYVFHPGFGYFADAYGLQQVAVEAGGRSPTPKQLQALIEQARKDRIKVIFVQPQSPQQSAQVIADAIGGKVVAIDGLAGNVSEDIEDIAAKMAAAMKGT